MSVSDCLFKIVETFKEEEALWTPGWWYKVVTGAVEMIKEQEPGLIISPYVSWQCHILKIIKTWSNCYEKWKVDSLEKLLTLTGPILASTLKTLLSSETVENAMQYMTIYVNKESLSKEICLDSQLMMTISTCSTIVPSLAGPANATGDTTYQPGSLLEAMEASNDSSTWMDSTGSMPSYITFLRSGEKKTYGLDVPIKDLKAVVRYYGNILIFNIARVPFR